MARITLTGIPVSAGICVGRAVFVNRRYFHIIPRKNVPAHLVPVEVERLEDAFARMCRELEQARSKVPAELKEHASLIDTHLMISSDPKLLGAAMRMAQEGAITAEWALERAVDEIVRAFDAIDNPYIRERVNDVRLVAERIQALLMGHDKQDIRAIEDQVVLLAHDLSPADTVELDPGIILAMVTVTGGKTSHTGILARSLEIPALVGVDGIEENVADGDLVVVDGLKGQILVDPDEKEVARYNRLKTQFENYQAGILRTCGLPGETLDGFRVQVLANIELSEDVDHVLAYGGEGVGLYRTEYAFLNRQELPEEEELVEEYTSLARRMNPRKVVFRTLDVGGDKLPVFMGSMEEPNPALGLRAIRFCLRHQELFKRQLRAILRASAFGNASVMFPMISGLHEVRQARHLLWEARQELKREGLKFDPAMPLGIMVELPSAVMIADVLAREVDFFSIGTNDLIQYSLGIDRTNRNVSYLYQPLHPAVVRSIKQVVDSGHEAGIEVMVCGELASDPYYVPILMGMQVDGISITAHAIPGIKRIIRRATLDECKDLLRSVLGSDTVTKINRQVRKTIFDRFPEELVFYSSLNTDEA